MRALLDGGADIDGLVTYSDGTTGITALAAACWRGHTNAVDALLEAGADVDLAGTHPRCGVTPLVSDLPSPGAMSSYSWV